MRRMVALLVAVAALAGAALLLAFAADVRRWQTQLAEDDARFQAYPVLEDLWRGSTILPDGVSANALGVVDDVRHRRAVSAFFVARPRHRGLQRPELEGARGEAQVVLTQRFRDETDPRRKSELANLLGALALAVIPQQVAEQRTLTLESAVAYLQEAVRFDPRNEDAKYNLEAALRRLDAEPPKLQESPGGRQPRADVSGAGLRDPGSGY